MSRSEKVLTAALLKSVKAGWLNDPTGISTKHIRSTVEHECDLKPGFFKDNEDWKEKSRKIIVDEFNRLEAGEDSEKTSAPESKAPPASSKKAKASPQHPKRSSKDASKPPPAKRQRKASTPTDEESDLSSVPGTTPNDIDDASASSELSDLSEDEEPQPKKRAASKSTAKAKKQSKRKNASLEDVSSGIESGSSEKEGDAETSKDGGQDSDSDMSVLIDEAPQPKAKKSSASGKAPKKPTKPKAPVEQTADETELKTLQSQLKKCGINKIWGFELKQFEEDTKAKVRHLKKMLREVGMESRFSEARAKEIKERRELLADVEAISAEGPTLGAARERRSKVKAEKSLAGGVDTISDSSAGEEEPVRERIAAAKQDLAFLGSESESD